MKMGEEGVPAIEEFLLAEAGKKNGFVIGFDGRVVPSGFTRKLKEKLEEAGCKASFSTGKDLGGEVWKDRPEIKPTKAWELPLSSAASTCGKSKSHERISASCGISASEAGAKLLKSSMSSAVCAART